MLCSGILKVLPEYSFPLLYIVIKESIALTLSAVIIVYGFTNNKRSLIFSALRSTIIGKIGFVVSAFVVAMILTDTYTTLAQWTGAITIAITSINYIIVLMAHIYRHLNLRKQLLLLCLNLWMGHFTTILYTLVAENHAF